MLSSLSQDKVSELFRWWYFKIIRATSPKHHFIITTYHSLNRAMRNISFCSLYMVLQALVQLTFYTVFYFCFLGMSSTYLSMTFTAVDRILGYMETHYLFLCIIPKHRDWSLSFPSVILTIYHFSSHQQALTLMIFYCYPFIINRLLNSIRLTNTWAPQIQTNLESNNKKKAQLFFAFNRKPGCHQLTVLILNVWFIFCSCTLKNFPTFEQINTLPLFAVVCKLAEGALNLLIQIIDKDIISMLIDILPSFNIWFTFFLLSHAMYSTVLL